MNDTRIPNPRTQYEVIKRYLHVLALLQNSEDRQNARTISELLTAELQSAPDKAEVIEGEEEGVSDKTVRDYIEKNLRRELEIDIDTEKGGRKITLSTDLEGHLLEEIALLYSGFIVSDDSRKIALKQLIKAHPRQCLWILARLYFAAIERRRIRMDYTTGSGYEINGALVNPYHLVFRNNNIYLLGRVRGKDEPWLFIVSQVRKITVTDERFDEEIPSLSQVFHETLGVFIGNSHDVVIRFDKSERIKIEQMLSILEPDIKDEGNGSLTASFSITDPLYLYMQLLRFGRRAEILEPQNLREELARLLRESLEVYD